MKRGWWILKVAVLGILAVALFGWVTLSLWNWLVPTLFNGPVINIWQAFGLLILSKILFSGLGGKGRGHWKHSSEHWKPYWKERYQGMSAEERQRLKERMKEKWCNWEEDTSSKATQESDSKV
jgi:hypothetical protein